MFGGFCNSSKIPMIFCQLFLGYILIVVGLIFFFFFICLIHYGKNLNGENEASRLEQYYNCIVTYILLQTLVLVVE